MLMLCIDYGIKRLSKLCKCILAPPVILTTSMHLQCSRMPAKVYYELSRRFGTRNVLTRTQGWIYWGIYKNYNSNTVVKQNFAVVKQVEGRAARITDTTRHQSWQSTPPPPAPHQIMLDPSLQEHYKLR